MRQYWQPNIDNWVLNENDATAFSNYGSGFAGADFNANGVPVEQAEEEVDDNLEHTHKGISKFSELRDKIEKNIENIYDLSKVDKDSRKNGNHYDLILQMIKDPELIGMLESASHEMKRRSISSF